MSANIEAFLNNPLSISDADMENLLQQQDDGSVDQIDTGDEAGPAAEAKQGDVKDGGASTASEDKGAAEVKEAKVDEIDPSKAEVLTKDGKHTIPYSVLQKERDRAAAAEQLANQEREERTRLEATIAELQRQAKESPAAAAARSAPAVVDVISPEQLNALKDEAPELAAIVEGLVNQIGQANERATKAEEVAQRNAVKVAEREAGEAERLVDDAIGKNPKLIWARTEKPEVFNAIVEYDQFMRKQPAAANMPLDERFAKSVAMYEAVHGAIEVPGFARTVTTAAQLSAAPAVQRGPSTLSDIPGGAVPPRSDLDAIGAMSSFDLTQKLMDMSDAERDKFLARVALS